MRARVHVRPQAGHLTVRLRRLGGSACATLAGPAACLARDHGESGEPTNAPKRLRPATLTGASRRRVQNGPCLEFSEVEHQFVSTGKWALAVVENDESTHAEVCNFACSAAMRDLFMRRLGARAASTGDDAGLTRLLCPCAEDLQYMLEGNVPNLPSGQLEELVAGMQEEVCGKLTLNEGVLQLLQRLRVALGLQPM